MEFPKPEILKKYIKSIEYIRTLESSRDKEDNEVFQKLINKEISEKEAYLILKQKKKINSSKELKTKKKKKNKKYNKKSLN